MVIVCKRINAMEIQIVKMVVNVSMDGMALPVTAVELDMTLDA